MDAKPYVPNVQPPEQRGLTAVPYPPVKPWMARQEGELPHEHMARLSHTCYHCGVYIVDGDALDAHEAEHGTQAD